MTLVEISGLMVRRSDRFCLEVKCLKLPSGSILGVTGPNGSGKTTLVHSLAGLIRPDQGKIFIGGQLLSNNLRETKSLLGFVPDDEDWLIKELCAREYFNLLARVYAEAGVQTDIQGRIAELCKILHFTSLTVPLATLSHGNKKKVQIIAALMHQPRIIVLDEIRNGLDPLAIIAVEKLILSEAGRGASIIASTHDLWWAERLAETVLLLVDGKVVAQQKTAVIVARSGSLESFFLKTINKGN